MIMDLKDKKVTVIGLAKTGIALIKFLKNKGARVFASDSSCCEKMLKILKEIFNNDLDYETNGKDRKSVV